MLYSNFLFRASLILLIAHRSFVDTKNTTTTTTKTTKTAIVITTKSPALVPTKANNTAKPIPIKSIKLTTSTHHPKLTKGFTTKSPTTKTILSATNNSTRSNTKNSNVVIVRSFNVTSTTSHALGNRNTSTTTTTKTTKTTTATTSKVQTFTLTVPPNVYCTPSLCELYNGSHIFHVPHIGCNNNGSFGPACGAKPHLLYMNQRRRQFILDMHNLARERIASGQLTGYRSAAHMPMLKWDDELAYLAKLHVKRCQFDHDRCRNTPRYQFSGQNIGYFWIGREFKSHAKRIKSFILNWFKEYRDCKQTFIDKYIPHPEGKKIGHFTMLVSDRAHRVGCAAIRYRDPKQIEDMKLLMTCNYDFTNILGEPIYQKGPAASKCIYRISDKYPSLCDWKDAVYDYESEESLEGGDNDNAIDSTFIN